MSRPRDPYDWVESWAWPLIERGAMRGCAELVLLRLAAHGNRDGMARPSAETLARQVGRSARAVRLALEVLRDAGLIDGDIRHGRATNWRLVTDEDEQNRLHELRTHRPESTPDPPSGVLPPQLRSNSGGTPDPSRDEGEGEGTSKSTPSPSTELKHVSEGEVEFYPNNLIEFRRAGAT